MFLSWRKQLCLLETNHLFPPYVQIHYEIKKLHGSRCYFSRQEASCALVSTLMNYLSWAKDIVLSTAVLLANFKWIFATLPFQPALPVPPLPAVIQVEERQCTKILQNTHRTFKGTFKPSDLWMCNLIPFCNEMFWNKASFYLTEFSE